MRDKVYGIIITRVSSPKQAIEGDSHAGQEKTINQAVQRTESTFNCQIEFKQPFLLSESATVADELQPLLKVVEYCKKEGNIRFAFIKSIDRATRAGGGSFEFLKKEFAKAGTILIDAYGIINPKMINTLEHLGVKYKWSEYYPSSTSEMLEAERAKAEVRDILSRMLGAEIQYVRQGYSMGSTK